MKDNSGMFTKLLVFAASLFVMVSLMSCKKEEPRQEQRAATGPAINPYSDDSAFAEVKKKLDENPNDPDALFHLADLYDRSNQYPEAIEAYKKVIKVKPTMGYAYLKLGTAYDRLNKSDEAIETLKKAAKYMPTYAVVFNNLGVAYGKSGKLNEEIEALKKAIKLRSEYSSARYNLGVTYLKVGNKKGALQEYESLKKFDEGAAEALRKEIDKSAK